jgi:glycosyltransferase involved in cell wall biosynthesis
MINVALLSYPMLFQRQGGLQIQVLETLAALNQRPGITARLFNPLSEQLSEVDVVHVFAAINGNYRLLQAAKQAGKPVVLSPLLQPDWTAARGRWRRGLARAVARLSGWDSHTSDWEIAESLALSDAIIALSAVEQQAISAAFLIPAQRINTIANGIAPRFFNASPQPFLQHSGLAAGFVLCVASISPYKNQLRLAQALAGSGRQLVVIGACAANERDYLAQLQAFPNVHYLGSLAHDDPLLASAYAAAGVFCLPSLSEVMPLTVLEALAAGTPVIMTHHHALALNAPTAVLRTVDPLAITALAEAIEASYQHPATAAACQQTVQGLSWPTVAKDLALIYQQLLDR